MYAVESTEEYILRNRIGSPMEERAIKSQNWGLTSGIAKKLQEMERKGQIQHMSALKNKTKQSTTSF